MGSISRWVLATFASPAGVLVLAVGDSTLFFSFPFGIDAAIIIVAARSEERAWMVPLLATAGSLAGAAFTFWLGAKAGDAGLERFIPPRQLERARSKVRHSGAIALAALSIIPPPFPFTPFVLAAGALDVHRLPFFATLTASRLARFSFAAVLAVRYGRSILGLLETPALQYAVVVCIVLAFALTAWSAWQLVRRTRRPATA